MHWAYFSGQTAYTVTELLVGNQLHNTKNLFMKMKFKDKQPELNRTREWYPARYPVHSQDSEQGCNAICDNLFNLESLINTE